MLQQIVSKAIRPSIKQRHQRRHNLDDDYTPQTVSDGCAKAFVVVVLLTFAIKAIWKFMI